jgi:UDP-N-acetylmuramoyl-tripeptide--D-alanyl-D-alanine ligase
MGGSYAGEPERRFSGASLDSRRVCAGELFFALRGERTDGHRFVGEALARGAAAAVVEHPVEAPPEVLIEVPRTYDALHALTRVVRRTVPARGLVGITGSTGKTTTKELLATLLRRRYRVARTPGNLNNLLGFPLSLLGVPDDCEWMVAELGMSTPGELREISLLARPDVALFTNVRPVHLEFFGSLEAIAEAKSELLAGLAAGGLIVANADDAQVERIARRHAEEHGNPVRWYGRNDAAQVRVEEVREREAGPGSAFTLVADGQAVAVELPLHGLYNVDNFLAAAAAATALGVELEAVAQAAGEATGAPNRGAVHRLAAGATLIDDSYNSNPVALEAALASARRLDCVRHWAVVGDMLELGPEAPRFHRDAGERAARLGFSPLLAVGALAGEVVAGARAAGASAEALADAEAAASRAAAELRDGDVVLVKGSRGVRLERVVEALLGAGERPAGREPAAASPAERGGDGGARGRGSAPTAPGERS